MCVCAPHLRNWALTKELLVTAHIMQSFLNQLSTQQPLRVYVNKSDTYVLKSLHSRWVYSWLCGKISSWHKSQPGFNPTFKHLACLTTLKSCDTTKQSVCGWLCVCVCSLIFVLARDFYNMLFCKFLHGLSFAIFW